MRLGDGYAANLVLRCVAPLLGDLSKSEARLFLRRAEEAICDVLCSELTTAGGLTPIRQREAVVYAALIRAASGAASQVAHELLRGSDSETEGQGRACRPHGLPPGSKMAAIGGACLSPAAASPASRLCFANLLACAAMASEKGLRCCWVALMDVAEGCEGAAGFVASAGLADAIFLHIEARDEYGSRCKC
eukprot:evm.model.scf_3311.2 EVM.evm.TU.scf_3311.2   scf_3311:3892-7407(-)